MSLNAKQQFSSRSRSGPGHQLLRPAVASFVCLQRRVVTCKASPSDDAPPSLPGNKLEATIRRKQRELEVVIKELGMETLDDRLQDNVTHPANPPYRLSTLIAESVPKGHCVLAVEVCRPSPASKPNPSSSSSSTGSSSSSSSTPATIATTTTSSSSSSSSSSGGSDSSSGSSTSSEAIPVPVPSTFPSPFSSDLSALARTYISLGADALVVRCDSDDTPSGLRDLFSVVSAAGGKVPVIARNWLIHPLQVIEAKEAGAAGVLGIIHQVNGKGTAIMSSFTSAIGLDAPVEVVNNREVAVLAQAGVVFYAVSISVGISLSIPGFAADLANGILGELPFGSISMVGVSSVEGARAARAAGADSLLIKKELVEAYEGRLPQLFDELRYAVSGDD